MDLELYTERLWLRPYDPSDVDLDIELATDPEVMKYFGGVVSEAQARVESDNYTRRCGGGCIGVWTVLDKGTHERLGEVFLTPLPVDAEDTQWELISGDDIPDGDIEVGFMLKRSVWGRGLATEACQRLLRFAFEEAALEEIVAVVEEGNVGSEKVLLKSGLLREGMRRAYAGQCPAFRITRAQYMARQDGPS
ncbi:MAG: GNAT family N-acetyltransferase [Pseudomonadota bacterium]